MKLILALLFALAAIPSLAGTAFTSAQSGLWDTPATWVANSGYPQAAGDTFTIATGHTVIYDIDNSATAGFGASVITGTLQMTHTNQCFFKMNGNITGTGPWVIGYTNPTGGTVGMSYAANHLPYVVVLFTSGRDNRNLNNGFRCYGDTNAPLVAYLSNSVAIAGTQLWVSNAIPLVSNDVIFLGRTDIMGTGGSIHLVTNCNANEIDIGAPINFVAANTNTWWGQAVTALAQARTTGAIVVNLSRPVVIANNPAQGFFLANCSWNTLIGNRFQSMGSVQSLSTVNYTCLNGVVSVASSAILSGASNTVYNCVAEQNGGSFGLANGCSYSTFTNDLILNANQPVLYNPILCNATNCGGWGCQNGGVSSLNQGHCNFDSCWAQYCNFGLFNDGYNLLSNNCWGNYNSGGGLGSEIYGCYLLNCWCQYCKDAALTTCVGNYLSNCWCSWNTNGGFIGVWSGSYIGGGNVMISCTASNNSYGNGKGNW